MLACTQLSLVAIQHHRQPDRSYLPKEAPEGVSAVVDRIANSKYGLLGPLPGPGPAATPKIEGVPLDTVLIMTPEPAPLENVTPSDTSQAPAWLWPIVEEESRSRGLDPLLIESMIRQESGFRPDAVSPVGAQGLMQLMPETAERFGLPRGVRHHPEPNLRAGMRYLKGLLNTFDQDVALALAAYNAGEGAVARYGRRIPPYPETQTYVRRVTDRLARFATRPGGPRS